MLLDRLAILNADDLPRERVEVPEWGGHVFVRTLTGAERDSFENETVLFRPLGQSGPNMDAMNRTRARLCARAMCDEEGRRIFSDDDVAALSAKSAAALDRVYEVAARLSKIGRQDMEELVKNSASAPGGASCSDSPAPLAAASANCS
jgi:hypothetical protein